MPSCDQVRAQTIFFRDEAGAKISIHKRPRITIRMPDEPAANRSAVPAETSTSKTTVCGHYRKKRILIFTSGSGSAQRRREFPGGFPLFPDHRLETPDIDVSHPTAPAATGTRPLRPLIFVILQARRHVVSLSWVRKRDPTRPGMSSKCLSAAITGNPARNAHAAIRMSGQENRLVA